MGFRRFEFTPERIDLGALKFLGDLHRLDRVYCPRCGRLVVRVSRAADGREPFLADKITLDCDLGEGNPHALDHQCPEDQ